MSNENASTAPERNAPLDGIRGYAALVVVAYHCIAALAQDVMTTVVWTPVYDLVTLDQVATKVLLVIFNGDAAVVLFFILSGCVLTTTIMRDMERFGFVRTSVAFVVRRFLRLYPAMFVYLWGMIIILALWLVVFSRPMSEYYFSAEGILRNFLLISPDVGGHTWTILLEMAVVPFLLVFGYLALRWGWKAFLAFVVLAMCAQHYPWLAFDYLFLPDYLVNFALGCLIPLVPGRAVARLGRIVGWLPLLIGFMAVRLIDLDPKLHSALGFMFLCVVYHDPPEKLAGFLNHRISQYLGRISFGVYLWHYVFTVMLYLPAVLFIPDLMASHPLLIGIAAFFPILAVTLVMAELSERYVEKPGIRLGYRLSHLILSYRRPTAESIQGA